MTYQLFALPNTRAVIFIFVFITTFTLDSNQAKQINSNRVYTIDKAQNCFHNQALRKCQDIIQKCINNEICQKQLKQYEECNFQKQIDQQIFNGYCFRRWLQDAVQSKQLINCVQKQCNFAGYNSHIGLRELYQCSQQALIQFQQPCDDQCHDQLKQKISQKLFYKPLEQLYSFQSVGQFRNDQAKIVTQIISKQCISKEGSVRIRHQKQQKQNKRNRRTLNIDIQPEQKQPKEINNKDPILAKQQQQQQQQQL